VIEEAISIRFLGEENRSDEATRFGAAQVKIIEEIAAKYTHLP
jgi:hypothetical protein